MNMTTLEELFVGIFERKDRIIEQLQREADAYTEELASRLLIDGITPPPCLLNPRFNSRSSNPHELKKEEIISKFLLGPPRASVAYSSGGPSHYYRPAVTGGHGPLPNEMSMETHAPNKALHVTNEPPVTLASPNDNIECNLNEQDNSVNSPQKETDARISSIYAAPDSSLARIQRSKSRQKARELRNSGKTSAKSCLGDENRTRISFNGNLLPKSDIHQVTQDKCPSEVDKSNDITQGKSLQQSCHDNGGIKGINDINGAKSLDEERKGKYSQQSGHDNGVIGGVNLVDTSLGSYEAKKTVTGLTHGSQRQSKLYSDRITRSRFSTQQTSGTNKSLGKDTSVSCYPKEGKGALSDSVGDLNLGVNGSKKFLDAVETSQVVKDVQKPVISSNIVASRVTRSKSGSVKDVKKPVISSNIGVDHKEDGATVKGNMLVKPKQLNFDEMDGCDSSKISSLVSKKRNLGHEHSPSMDSGSLKDKESSGTFFESQVQMDNVLSSQSKSASTHSNEDSDECTNVETMNVGLDMIENENPMVVGQECNPILDSDSLKDHKSSGTFFEQKVQMENEVPSQLEDEKTHSPEDVDQNAEVSLHDDVAVLCEVDLHNKGEKSADGALIPVSKDPKPSYSSSLIKQRDNDYEIFLDKEVRTSYQDLGSSKSKEFEPGTNSKLSHLKLNSEKVNTWPRDPQKKVDDQRKCFSDSQGSKIHAQKDTIHCDLEAFKDDLHVTKSDDIQDSDKIVHDDMMCDLPEKTEATVMEVDDYTLNQSGPNLIDDVATTDQITNDDVAVSVDGSDENMPVYEGFTINEKEFENTEDVGIDFTTLEIPTTTTERASLLEQICKDSITNTPFSQFSSFKQHQVQDLYRYIPDGLVEDMDLEKHSDCDITDTNYSFPNTVQFSSTPFTSKNYYSSPVGKFWDRSASSSGSSENRLSSNPELTCFPIEEDPNSNEERENDEIQENKEKIPVTETETVKRENDDDVAVPKPANYEPPSGKMKYRERCSSNSVNIEVNVPRTFDKVKYKSKFERTPSISTRASVKRSTSIQTQNSRIKSTIQRQRPSQKEGKRNNIVTNITSFVSLVQQKQAAAACPGKREIKVKALEAAEVARRREEEKERERKMKKEALKMERARIEKENAREMEINKKRKIEEIKKREADVAARKKQREEDERKPMVKKRKINEAKKVQRGGKVVNVGKKGTQSVTEITKENKNANIVVQEEIGVPENVDKEKSPTQVRLTSQEESCSYEISPYQCSDEDEEDDLPNNKFVPSWASKRAVAMVLPMQQEVDPETIFPVESFCSMDEVLLPRRLQTH